MSKLLDPDYINGLSEEQFAQVFEKLRSKIQEDPMEYFVKSPLFCNFDPVAGQVVALKLIFDQALDPDAKSALVQHPEDRRSPSGGIRSGGIDRYLYDAVPQFPVSQGRDSQGQSTLRLLPVSVN